jgi:hypothetical protein
MASWRGKSFKPLVTNDGMYLGDENLAHEFAIETQLDEHGASVFRISSWITNDASSLR